MKPKFLTPTQAAALWGVSRQRVHQWLKVKRIAGAKPIHDAAGRVVGWSIPATAKPPEPGKRGPKTAKTRRK